MSWSKEMHEFLFRLYSLKRQIYYTVVSTRYGGLQVFYQVSGGKSFQRKFIF